MIFILDKLWSDSIPNSRFFEDGFDIELPFWFYILGIAGMIAIVANTVISLFLSFKPELVFKSFLKNKKLLLVIYVIEIIVLPFIIYIAVRDINETFFPKIGVFGNLFDFAFPTNPNTKLFEKLRVLDFAIFCLCSLYFCLFFWKIISKRKISNERKLETITIDA
jgi:hypothetical protein